MKSYLLTHKQQLELLNDIPFTPTILIGEHYPVITLGRSQKSQQNILTNETDIPVVQTERGGDVTYHGPGQLVVYPIMKLEGDRRDLHQHLRMLEEVVILSLKEIGLTGERKEKLTGVWIQDKKVCSIGVAVKNIKGVWITYHGLALNVCCDLSPFHLINPCGLDASIMANVCDFLPNDPPADVKECLKQALIRYTSDYICNPT